MILDNAPLIKTSVDAIDTGLTPSIHNEFLERVLKNKFPLEDFLEEAKSKKNLSPPIIPWVSHSLSGNSPGSFCLDVIFKRRTNAFKFLFELTSHWSVPGKHLNVSLLYAVDFSFPNRENELFTFCKMVIDVESKEDSKAIENNLSILVTEIKLGLESSFYARRILESKGLASEEKTARVQEYVAYLIKRYPKFFDLDFLSEMQHQLVIWKDDFKIPRQTRHLVRIISLHYLFRKWIREAVQTFRGKRYLSLKINRSVLKGAWGTKKVLSILVGMNLLKEKEVFQKKHLLLAIQNYIPSAIHVENSFFSNYIGNEGICTFYIEVQKNEGEFSDQEISLLKQELPADLKDRIEHPMHPIFMPRNDEEIMRNILALGHQIKYVRDIPQVVISFDEQTGEHIFFTLILVRVLKPQDKSLQELFSLSDSKLQFIHERSKNIGFIRKKYIKDAQVFRLKLPKEKYLRKDHSIDLFKARQHIIRELVRLLGDVRDFNGGMIDKQNELLEAIRELLGDEIKYSGLLLDKYFCSLLPIGIRVVINPLVLKKMFVMLVESMETTLLDRSGFFFLANQDPGHVYVMVKEERNILKENNHSLFAKMGISSSEIIQSHILEQGIYYSGFIYPCGDSASQKHFLQNFQCWIEACYASNASC